MLVLPRKENEVIVLDNDIMVTVVKIEGDSVKLGISIPPVKTIHRREIYAASSDFTDKPPTHLLQ